VVSCGTDRGNEVLAQLAARLDAPFVANVSPADLHASAEASWELTRVRWGGSLLERATVTAPVKLLSVGLHAVEAVAAEVPAAAVSRPFAPTIDPASAVTIVRDRVEREAGVTLATASVVVGGGRGVGSAEGFAPLEELAAALGGVVGCSRAVTNNGWRNHTDQVGQTGTRIGADVYFACGISGAIQHWVGASGAKCIIAVNTDPAANMVTKADYAVIGDLHEVIPAITAELAARRV
jgi:electron transfer flavoprotein alpha subunit